MTQSERDGWDAREADDGPALVDNVAKLLERTSSSATDEPAAPIRAAARARILGSLLEAYGTAKKSAPLPGVPTLEGAESCRQGGTEEQRTEEQRTDSSRASKDDAHAPAPKDAAAPLRAWDRFAKVRELARDRRVRGGFVLLVAASVAMWLWFRGVDRPMAIRHVNDGPAPRTLALSDGSTVVLASGAELVERGARQIELVRGAAIFDVRASDARFVVKTPQGSATALGTRFLVEVEAELARVAVARGKVEVDPGEGQAKLVHAGEEGRLRGGQVETRRAQRMSHLFGFARPPEAEPRALGPARRGTLIARDPTWGGEHPLPIRDFEIDVHVEGGVARTTIDQTFFNQEARQLEGVYSLPLPHGAAISRLAMYVDGQLMEGAVVERDRGRDIYENIVYQRRDPALLEWMSGNVFRMRVFPLPARAEKRIFLSYTQALEHLYDRDRLVVPIPAMDFPAVKAGFRVRVVGAAQQEIASPSHEITVEASGDDKIVRFERAAYTLGDDFVLTMRSRSAADAVATFEVGSSRYVHARAQPDLLDETAADPAPGSRRWVVLVDTSASRTPEDLDAQRRFVERLTSEIDDEDAFALVAVGHDARPMSGQLVPAWKTSSNEVAAFLNGSSDGIGDTRLDVALGAAVELLDSTPRPDGVEDTIVYLGDGMATGGETDPLKLSTIVAGRARFVGLAVGDRVDMRLLDGLADATDGLVATMGSSDDVGHRAFDLVSTLRTPCVHRLEATILDASGAAVRAADDAGRSSVHLGSKRFCDGERLDVIGRLDAKSGAAKVRVTGRLAGRSWSHEISVASPDSGAGYLPRLWAQRHVEALLAAHGASAGVGASADAERSAVVTLAMEHFLVTPHTSLLVLENDRMYEEFKVERRAPEAWARYDAPDRIPVVTEPLGSERRPTSSWGTVIQRAPIAALRAGVVTSSPRGPIAGSVGGFDLSPKSRGARIDLVSAGDEGFGFLPEVASVTTESTIARDERAFRRSGAIRNGSEFGRLGLLGPSRTNRTLGGDVPMYWSPPDMAGWGQPLSPSMLAFQGQSIVIRAEQLDDLTEFAPALFHAPVDAARDYLIGLSATATPTSSPRAAREGRDLLAAGAAARPTGTFRAGPNDLVTFSADGTFERRLTPATGLQEITRFDGEALTATYPELGIRVVRPLGPAAAWSLANDLPLWLPPPSTTESLDVRSIGERSLRIAAPVPPAGTELELPAIEYELDEAGRVARLRGEGSDATTIEITYTANGFEIRRGAVRRIFERADAPTPTSDADLVEVVMPLRDPAFLLDQQRKTVDGSDDWLHLQHQILASHAAMGPRFEDVATVQAIAKHRGKLARGELALASGLVRWLPAELPASLADGDVVRLHAEASRAHWSGEPKAADKLDQSILDAHPSTLSSTLSSYRLADKRGERLTTDDERRILDFVATSRFAPLRLSAVLRAASPWTSGEDRKRARRLWEALASDPELQPIAERMISRILRHEGAQAEAAEMAERAYVRAFERGDAPDVDMDLRYTIEQGGGPAAYRVFWSRLRAKVFASGTPEQVASLLRSLLSGVGPAGPDGSSEMGAILRRMDAAPALSPARLQTASLLLGHGRAAEAASLLRPALDAGVTHPAVLEIAAGAAEAAGDLEGAATTYDRLLEVTEHAPVPLANVQFWYARLFDLRLRVATTRSSGRTLDLEAALAVAARWRREDPDNTSIDLSCARALFDAGRRDDAVRYLSSIVERRPAEGASYATVAEALEQRGETDAALEQWEKAISVEPTNPTWALRAGQVRLVRGGAGDAERARRHFDDIVASTWQDRFRPIVEEARRLATPKTPR